ncbi:sensor domain-containing diguanylate cyclase [Vibrio sp. TRT 17S01]|uniref:sensor domain-containing diguanylate cyclase n=1 Tax=Vibrio sp. TRT 17S01 TaxID=3418505 RepID=UPI003CFB59CE
MQTNNSERVIRGLYQITNDYQKGFDIQVTQLLMMGLEGYNLDIAILSKIEGNTYTILNCVTPEEVDLNPGDSFDFNDTYCEITCRSYGPVAIEHMGESEYYARHPAYKTFGLESYIGIPIFVDDEVFGTLNFSSAKPYPGKFDQFDLDILKLMASWIEVELIRRNQERELKKLNEKLEFQANFDSLTMLPNRRSIFRTLKRDIEHMRTYGGKGTLAVADIDHFKKVNDTYGHQKGDEILQQVAMLLNEQLTEQGVAARFGGEEFLIWIPGGTIEQRHHFTQELCQCVNKIMLDDKPVTISIGAVDFDFAMNTSEDENRSLIDQLILIADECMYQAKQRGRNCVVYKCFQIEPVVTK